MTSFTAVIMSLVDEDTFDVRVERVSGPYGTDIRPNERIRMVNREVNALRPGFGGYNYQATNLIGKRVHCEVHSRAPDLQLVVTARPI